MLLTVGWVFGLLCGGLFVLVVFAVNRVVFVCFFLFCVYWLCCYVFACFVEALGCLVVAGLIYCVFLCGLLLLVGLIELHGVCYDLDWLL